jgi:hypothetical protein
MEVGEIAISAIEDGMKLLHDFETPLTADQSPYLLSHFNFEYQDHHSSDLVLKFIVLLYLYI